MRVPILRIAVGTLSFAAFMGIEASRPTPKVQAFAYDCVLIYDKPGDIWINLYKENVHGNQGQPVGSRPMDFHRGLQFGINPQHNGPNKRLRYDYKNGTGRSDAWQRWLFLHKRQRHQAVAFALYITTRRSSRRVFIGHRVASVEYSLAPIA